MLRNLGELEWALRDMRVALELEPEDGWYHYRAGQIVAGLSGQVDARPYFRKAMDFADVRQAAMALYCQSFVLQKQLVEAGDCTRDFVTEYPTDGEAWRLRSFHLESVGSEETDAAYDRFLQYADPEDALHQKEVAEIREWRMQQKRKEQGR